MEKVRLILRGIVALAMMVAVVYVTSDTLTKMDPYKMEPLNKIGIWATCRMAASDRPSAFRASTSSFFISLGFVVIFRENSRMALVFESRAAFR